MGKLLTALSKAGQITALRAFFRDCHEWGWLPRQFDPPASVHRARRRV
jgi:hypothetical protein